MNQISIGTLCSGIEGAAVAAEPLDWRHAYCAEVDPFCCKLLQTHYPEVPNLGDILRSDCPPVDVIIAGTPCQSFSVNTAGRGGLADPRGQLALRFVEILRESCPRWFVWENVPGVLSANRGRDFGAFCDAVAELGYSIAWRVLNATGFGVPQRRRRVFVVGHCSDFWQRPAAVLFDPEARQVDAGQARKGRAGVEPAGASASPLLGWTGDPTPKFGVEVCPTLRACQGGEGVGVIGRGVFRRLTVDEWEQLQGFPAGYTAISGAGVTARRKALGNSFAVPVMAWILRRLNTVAIVERLGLLNCA